MKKEYTKLEMEIVEFDNEDVITASQNLDTLEDNEGEVAEN